MSTPSGEGDFNPRSRKESDASSARISRSLERFQSTLSQGERRETQLNQIKGITISIHALARRATRFFSLSRIACSDFNPRSRKESDQNLNLSADTYKNFNPRSRKESDVASTRTPTSGLYFNPRSRKESDAPFRCISQLRRRFQSTLSQGERRTATSSSCDGFSDFNPRSRKESDACCGKIGVSLTAFQSTLSQGERQIMLYMTSFSPSISIHALARRATQVFNTPFTCVNISIHALARRATNTVEAYNANHFISIHALARRATYKDKDFTWPVPISIHALARRATITNTLKI